MLLGHLRFVAHSTDRGSLPTLGATNSIVELRFIATVLRRAFGIVTHNRTHVAAHGPASATIGCLGRAL